VEIFAIAAAAAAQALSKGIVEKVITPKSAVEDVSARIQSAIGSHLTEVVNWSRHVHSLETSAPADTATSTIAIAFESEPRRFRSKLRSAELTHEADILTSVEHTVILGNPGSGKTTAIKRMAQRLLLEPPESSEDGFQFPLVVRLRELDKGQTLSSAIAFAIGLDVQVTQTESVRRGVSIGGPELHVGREPLDRILPSALSALRPVILLDGLDEVSTENRLDISEEIEKLGRRLQGAKIVVTSRTGDYTSPLEGFVALQLCPLTEMQIREIAERWLGDASEFMKALKTLPYMDVADRPLLLSQLLLLYRRHGFLPEQPAQVYKRVIRVLLEDWDAHNHVTRTSKYAGFDPDRKSEFLAAIAFHLPTQFDEAELVRAFERVAETFGLPRADSVAVVREIESTCLLAFSSGVVRQLWFGKRWPDGSHPWQLPWPFLLNLPSGWPD